jgi:hypothetical protein
MTDLKHVTTILPTGAGKSDTPARADGVPIAVPIVIDEAHHKPAPTVADTVRRAMALMDRLPSDVDRARVLEALDVLYRIGAEDA